MMIYVEYELNLKVLVSTLQNKYVILPGPQKTNMSWIIIFNTKEAYSKRSV